MKKKMKSIFTLAAVLMMCCMGASLGMKDTKAEWQYCEVPENSEHYIYLFEYGIKDGTLTEQSVFEAIAYYNYLTPEMLDTFLKRGNIPSYIDDLIAVGRLPQGYTVSVSAPATTPPQTTPTTPSADTATQPQAPTAPVNTEPTLDESKSGKYIVVEENVKSYASYNKETEVRTWILGEMAEVKGLMSNGYYKVLDGETEQYIQKKNLATEESYEKSWSEVERVESLCETEGSVTYKNTISEEKRIEVLPATGHKEGLPEIAKEKTLFTKEVVETKCENCGETLRTAGGETRSETIVGIIGIVIVAVGVVFLWKKKRGM